MLWIGKVGSLVQVPSPRRGMDVTVQRASTAARTIGGGQVVSFAPGGRRVFKAEWATLPYDTYTALEAFHTGMAGPGPWVVLDSARRNHLSVNQAAATSAFNDASGFTVDASEGVSSTPDAWLRGPRSLRWTLPGTVTSGILDLDPPAGLVGVPAPAGQPWTLSGSLTLTGVAATVTVTPTLSWRRIDGSEVSVTLGTPVVVGPGAWSSFSASAGSPPAGAVALRAQLRVTPGVIATAAAVQGLTARSIAPPVPFRPVSAQRITGRPGDRAIVVTAPPVPRPGSVLLTRAPIATTDLLVDQLRLDMYASVRAWAPGTGVPRCSWVSLTDVETWVDHRMPVEATLVEVG